ncbi:hypothetical protein AB0J83_40275 [Actinoplanes sp. NPDC049596]
MYGGGRDFSDYYIERRSSAERIAVNEHLSALVARLRSLLFGD